MMGCRPASSGGYGCTAWTYYADLHTCYLKAFTNGGVPDTRAVGGVTNVPGEYLYAHRIYVRPTYAL